MLYNCLYLSLHISPSLKISPAWLTSLQQEEKKSCLNQSWSLACTSIPFTHNSILHGHLGDIKIVAQVCVRISPYTQMRPDKQHGRARPNFLMTHNIYLNIEVQLEWVIKLSRAGGGGFTQKLSSKLLSTKKQSAY